MNENDGRDREVREYVRSRMAANMPPEFTRDVMNDVHRTTQQRRGFAWPIFTGLVTVAAAVVVVVIGLGLLNQPDDGVGSEATPSPSASPEATESPTPTAPASEGATPFPTAEPSAAEGEFRPIHSMAPAEAFENGQTCEVTNAIVNAEPTTLTWRISFPEGWSTNEESTELRSSCTLFDSEPVGASDDQSTVAIVTETAPGGDFTTDGASVTTQEYKVDGYAAVRYEVEPGDGGFVTEPMVVWIVAIGGNLPAVGNDQPYLIFQTHSDDAGELTAWADVLDRMVATLDIGE
jgi:hypothetical protein